MFAYCNNNPVIFCDPAGNRMVPADILHSGAKPQFIWYDVPIYDQFGTNLCWAVCQIMVEDYFKGVKRSRYGAIFAAKRLSFRQNGKENWDTAGFPTNCASYNAEGRPYAVELLTIEDLYNHLNENGPLYAQYARTDDDKSSGHGQHLVVVTGVYLDEGLVYTNNPWGERGVQTYNEFLNGVYSTKYAYEYKQTFYLPVA